MPAHDYQLLASMAQDKARTAMHQGNPVTAREWIAAAAEADRAQHIEHAEPGVQSSIADELERIADALETLADQAPRKGGVT